MKSKDCNKVYSLYKITNVINGKIYYGITKRGKYRWDGAWGSHVSDATRLDSRAGNPGPNGMYSDIRLLGKNSFKFEILEYIDDEKKAREIESSLIESAFLSLGKDNVYNEVTNDRDPEQTFRSAKACKKQSETIRGSNNPNAKRVKWVEGDKEFNSFIECYDYMNSLFGISHSSLRHILYGRPSKKWSNIHIIYL